jgi:hypothetical protein
MSAPPLARALLVVLVVGCHHQEGEGTPATQDPNSNKPPPENAVTGSKIDLYLSQRGEVRVPVGPDRLKVAALIPGAAGAFTTIEGTVKTDGSFTIPDVPAGTYYLRVDHKYLWSPDWFPTIHVTDQRRIDLADLCQGRPDVAVASRNQPTNLVIDATGLSPYQTGDALAVYSQGADLVEEDILWAAAGSLHPGDTRLFGFTIDIGKLGFPNLIDGSKGDTVLFAHLTDRSPEMDEPIRYQAIADVLAPAPFTQRDGQAANISGVFKDVSQRELTVTWNLAAFAALAEEASPGSTVGSHDIDVYADPAGPGRLLSGSFPALLLTGQVRTEEPRDQTFHLSYGNPFPASWQTEAYFSTAFPSAWDPDQVRSYAGVRMPLAAATEGPVTPPISPPRGLQVNGQPAQVAVSGIGLTPTISWEAPASGSARTYTVFVEQKKAGSDDWDEAIDLHTEGRSVTVPPGYLQAGLPTYFRVIAYTSYDRERPYHSAELRGYASAVSGPLTP